MAWLLKVLSDMLQSPQPLSHFHICPKPKVKLGPTDFVYSAPPSFIIFSHYQTLVTSVSPMGSRSHRDGLANSLLSVPIVSVPPRFATGPIEFAWPTFCFTYTQIGPIEFT